MHESALDDGGHKRLHTQRPATVHIILEFGCAEGAMRKGTVEEWGYSPIAVSASGMLEN